MKMMLKNSLLVLVFGLSAQMNAADVAGNIARIDKGYDDVLGTEVTAACLTHFRSAIQESFLAANKILIDVISSDRTHFEDYVRAAFNSFETRIVAKLEAAAATQIWGREGSAVMRQDSREFFPVLLGTLTAYKATAAAFRDRGMITTSVVEAVEALCDQQKALLQPRLEKIFDVCPVEAPSVLRAGFPLFDSAKGEREPIALATVAAKPAAGRGLCGRLWDGTKTVVVGGVKYVVTPLALATLIALGANYAGY